MTSPRKRFGNKIAINTIVRKQCHPNNKSAPWLFFMQVHYHGYISRNCKNAFKQLNKNLSSFGTRSRSAQYFGNCIDVVYIFLYLVYCSVISLIKHEKAPWLVLLLDIHNQSDHLSVNFTQLRRWKFPHNSLQLTNAEGDSITHYKQR